MWKWATIFGILASIFTMLKRFFGGGPKIGTRLELTIEKSAQIKGFRYDMFVLAEKNNAMTNDIENCICMDAGVLRIDIHFKDPIGVGQFIFDVRERCRFVEAEVVKAQRYPYNFSELDVYVAPDQYRDGDESPPNGRPRSRDDETDVSTVTADSELAAFQSLERLNEFSKMDAAHLKPSRECNSLAENRDRCNRLAVTPDLHRALDGTYSRKTNKWKPWVRISATSVAEEPFVYKDKHRRSHERFRVHLKIDFMSKKHYTFARYAFDWRTDTIFHDEEGYLNSHVLVRKPEVFKAGVERMYEITTGYWEMQPNVEGVDSDDDDDDGEEDGYESG